jgi:hypothetical protein
LRALNQQAEQLVVDPVHPRPQLRQPIFEMVFFFRR